MKILRKICAALMLMLACTGHIHGATFADETLHYVITYKWGMIHKEAGEATMTLRHKGEAYNLMLTARTKPWADKVFRVRDTLTSVVATADLRPRRYVKSAHEGKDYARDVVDFTYSGNNVSAKTSRLRINKKGEQSTGGTELSATGPAFDMLSVFYFIRALDYRTLTDGKTATATIFSGKMAEKLTIRSLGKERIELRDKTHAEAWHIKFKFTSHGGKKSSDDIDAWISTGPNHIPLQLYGNLPVGQVRVYLVK